MAKTKRKSVAAAAAAAPAAEMPASTRKNKKSKKEAATPAKKNVEKALKSAAKPEQTESRKSTKSAKKSKSKRKRDDEEDEVEEEDKANNKKAAVAVTEVVVTQNRTFADLARMLPPHDAEMQTEEEGEEEKTITSHATKPTMPLSKGGAQRSLPASRRWWKGVEMQRSSMQVIGVNKRTMSSSWEKKMGARSRRQQLKEYETTLLAAKMERIQAEKAKKLEKKNRKAANEFKSTRFQVIKDMAKIKKMSKKQLRMIHKTRVDEAGNTITVPLYA